MATPSDYRPDIDGLRGLSVVLVMAYHAGLGFPGGFVGVDVFFVISGFLITRLIERRLDTGTFDVVDFYSRRVRRIVPAAAAMTLTTLLLGGLWLSPEAWGDLARSAIAEVAMVANEWFRRKIDYFGRSAELQPLLHTWSLAVEEQFYLVYPFALIVLRRFPRSARWAILVVTLAVSLLLSEYLLVRGRAVWVYYSLPSRAWELLLGGVVAMLPATRRHALWHEFESALGLTMILATATCFDGSIRFPGISALLPCIGGALIIHGQSASETIVGRSLSSRAMVAIGLLSYSLYLWHWPILALLRNLLGNDLPWHVASTAVAVAVLIAFFSRRWLEEPIRRGRSFQSGPATVGILLATAAMTTLPAMAILLNAGFPSRFSPATLRFFAAAGDRVVNRTEVGLGRAMAGDLPAFGDTASRRTILVWGDSHASMLVAGLDAACRKGGIMGLQATHSATPPLLDFNHKSRHGLGDVGPAFNEAVLAMIPGRSIELVILGGAWSSYAKQPVFEESLRRTVDRLVGHGVRVAIVLDPASFPRSVPETLAAHSMFNDDAVDFVVEDDEYRIRNQAAEAIIRRVAAGRATIIDPRPVLADREGRWAAQRDGHPLYWDGSHLSVFGSRLLEPLFENLFLETGVGEFPPP